LLRPAALVRGSGATPGGHDQRRHAHSEVPPRLLRP
jgi:hypothetical protein